MSEVRVPINSIVVNDDILQRVNTCDDCINEYSEAIARGSVFPPLIVFSDGEKMVLADGKHRLEAYKIAGIEEVTVSVMEGGLREALLFAVGANGTHGLRRTNADKRRAVLTMLEDHEWGAWSDGLIAEKCAVSQPFVSKLRSEVTQNNFEWTRLGKDGRVIKTEKIGKCHPAEKNKATESLPSNSAEVSFCSSGDGIEPQIQEKDRNEEASVDPQADKKEQGEVIENVNYGEEMLAEGIGPRETLISELEEIIKEKDRRIEDLERENRDLRMQIHQAGGSIMATVSNQDQAASSELLS